MLSLAGLGFARRQAETKKFDVFLFIYFCFLSVTHLNNEVGI